MKKLLLVISFCSLLLTSPIPVFAEPIDDPNDIIRYGTNNEIQMNTNVNPNLNVHTNSYRVNAVNDSGFDWGWLGLFGLLGLAGARNRSRDRA